MNREKWLSEASKALCSEFIFEDLDTHVSVGWPSRGGISTKKRVIGQCWKPDCSKDGKSHIFISPMIERDTDVLATLLHELIHAWDRCESGHKGAFVELAKKVGLERPWTATHAGEELQLKLERIAEGLGAYPHVPLEPTMVQKKVQTTRQLKVVCPSTGCGCVVRMTRTWIDKGLPTCYCGVRMVEDTPDEKEDE